MHNEWFSKPTADNEIFKQFWTHVNYDRDFFLKENTFGSM